MCGIVGVIAKDKTLCDENIIKKMTDTIIHRGPDGEGIYIDSNFAFGHRRLAIVDLSQAGHQPMHYKDRYTITYNGEVYNYIELRDELTSAGYAFQSDTDTEVIMAAYDYWGADCLNKFNGMWAFVIYDKQEDKFFLSRDRFGIKPFYYYKTEDIFIFASEIKAILEHPVVTKSPDLDYLKQYIKFGSKEYEEQTAFLNIKRFPFSCYAKLSSDELLKNDLKTTQYWKLKPNLKNEKFSQQKAEQYAKQYYDLLSDAVKIRLRADVKVGSALSGGLDSSSIVYLVNQQLKQQGKEDLQETFSTVYKSDGTQSCDESEFINIVANELNVISNQIEPKEQDIPAEHYKMIRAMEMPLNGSMMSAWHTFKLVKSREVVVTLDGQGADEQLGGYLYYVTRYIASLHFLDLLKESLFFIKNIPGIKRSVLKGFLMAIFRILFGRKALRLATLKLGKDVEININKILAQDTMSNLITLIHYADHNSMGHSVESRMPFMDYRLVEFLASVPASYKIHKGWTKYIARLAFNGKLPDDICWRKDKMGWPIPEEYWFRGNLREWFVKNIQDSKLLKHLKSDIGLEIDREKNLDILIRYLNIAVFEDVFSLDDFS